MKKQGEQVEVPFWSALGDRRSKKRAMSPAKDPPKAKTLNKVAKVATPKPSKTTKPTKTTKTTETTETTKTTKTKTTKTPKPPKSLLGCGGNTDEVSPNPNVIWFYDENRPWGEFSNFYGPKQDKRFVLVIDDKKWLTTEHYFQVRKEEKHNRTR